MRVEIESVGPRGRDRQGLIVAAQGPGSRLKAAVGSDAKGKISLLRYAAAIPLAFVEQRVSIGLYVAVALLWLVRIPGSSRERGGRGPGGGENVAARWAPAGAAGAA